MRPVWQQGRPPDHPRHQLASDAGVGGLRGDADVVPGGQVETDVEQATVEARAARSVLLTGAGLTLFVGHNPVVVATAQVVLAMLAVVIAPAPRRCVAGQIPGSEAVYVLPSAP